MTAIPLAAPATVLQPVAVRPTAPVDRPFDPGSLAPTPAVAAADHLGRVVASALAKAQLQVPYLGPHPLVVERRLYHPEGNRWLVCRAQDDPLVARGLPLPAPARAQLDRLVKAGFDFPYLYLAHELPDGKPASRLHLATPFEVVDAATATALLGDAPAPASSLKRAEQLDRVIGRGAQALGRAGTSVARSAAAIAAAPLALVDPIVFGAVIAPGTPPRPGTPAAWFLLTRWHW